MKELLKLYLQVPGICKNSFLRQLNQVFAFCIRDASHRNGILPQTEAKKGKFEDAGEGNAFGWKMHSIATYNRHQSMLISRSCTVGKFPLIGRLLSHIKCCV